MKALRIFSRSMVIGYTLARYRVDELVLHSGWFYSFRFIAYFNPMRYVSRKKLTRGERLRLALEQLGPIFVKFGQLLSTRRDLLPLDIANELANLQDQVKPFSGKVAKKIIEENLNKPITEIFKDFNEEALASASIAQVHAVTLLNGKDAVVKVLRPNVKKQIESDLEVLNFMARLAHYFLPNSKKIRPQEIISEFEMSLRGELDLMQEAANATTLRRNFIASNLLYIPEIYWDFCQKNVMVMERIYGIPANDIEDLRMHRCNLKELAEHLIEIFFTQVFKYNFFHADLHPGNLFVSLLNPGQLIAVDFGIVSSLSENDRRYIAENLLAFFHRDYRKVAELHIEAGWVESGVRTSEFEAAIRAVSEPVFEKPLKEISMGQLIMNLIRIARSFNIQIQPQLILLQKTLLTVEGLGRQLDPDLDLWSTAKPFLEKWLREQIGTKAFIKKVKENLPFWLEKLPDMPDLIYKTMLNIQESNRSTPVIMKEKKFSFQTLFSGLCCGLILGAGLMVILERVIH